jgi:hypothetical protein
MNLEEMIARLLEGEELSALESEGDSFTQLSKAATVFLKKYPQFREVVLKFEKVLKEDRDFLLSSVISADFPDIVEIEDYEKDDYQGNIVQDSDFKIAEVSYWVYKDEPYVLLRLEAKASGVLGIALPTPMYRYPGWYLPDEVKTIKVYGVIVGEVFFKLPSDPEDYDSYQVDEPEWEFEEW